jgi:hypothetical protein
MMMPARSMKAKPSAIAAAAIAVLLAAAGVYFWKLGWRHSTLAPDEAIIANGTFCWREPAARSRHVPAALRVRGK